MQFSEFLKAGVLVAAASLCIQGQSKDTPAEAKGIPPRASAADYQAHAQVGAVTIAAEFTGHSVPTAQGPLNTEDFVVVEVAFFGAPDAKVRLSFSDFSLRVNGKKAPLPSQPYGLALASLKDPEYEATVPTSSKSKTSVGGGGGKDGGDSNPSPPPVPIEVRRAMAQRTQKAALPEGDRALPVDGLVFFQYRGKEQGIHSVELIYAGSAGKATLNLHP
jgi:hypothetical protein